MSVLCAGFGGGRAAPPPSIVGNSLRFRQEAGANLTRSFSAGNRRTWTYSIWVKRAGIDRVDGPLFNAIGNRFLMRFSSGGAGNNFIEIYDFNGSSFDLRYITTQFFRDPNAWLHVQLNMDTTNTTASDRVQLFINNTRITSFSTATAPALNYQGSVNTANTHAIGSLIGFSIPYDGYGAEINFVDGQSVSPSEFGQVNPTTGVWEPKPYAGTYGTTGFYLDFADASSIGALGTDQSGNGNNWTPNNFSLTAGSTYDWMSDYPTVNHPTFTTIARDGGGFFNFQDGNLTLATPNSPVSSIVGCPFPFPASGKFYMEGQHLIISSASGDVVFGVKFGQYTGINNGGPAFVQSSGTPGVSGVYVNNVQVVPISTNSGDVWGLGFDLDADTFTAYLNGVLIYSGSTVQPLAEKFVGLFCSFGRSCRVNFGQRPFTYTPPTGHVALNTTTAGAVAPLTSGTFTGNANVDGPCVWLAGTPDTMTINGNAVVWGTHADRLSSGFKVRTSSASYNAAGANTFSVSSFVDDFTDPNNAKANP